MCRNSGVKINGIGKGGDEQKVCGCGKRHGFFSREMLMYDDSSLSSALTFFFHQSVRRIRIRVLINSKHGCIDCTDEC